MHCTSHFFSHLLPPPDPATYSFAFDLSEFPDYYATGFVAVFKPNVTDLLPPDSCYFYNNTRDSRMDAAMDLYLQYLLPATAATPSRRSLISGGPLAFDFSTATDVNASISGNVTAFCIPAGVVVDAAVSFSYNGATSPGPDSTFAVGNSLHLVKDRRPRPPSPPRKPPPPPSNTTPAFPSPPGLSNASLQEAGGPPPYPPPVRRSSGTQRCNLSIMASLLGAVALFGML